MQAVVDDQVEFALRGLGEVHEGRHVSLIDEEGANAIFVEQDTPINIGAEDLGVRQKVLEGPQ